MSEQVQRDDALFEALGKSQKQKKKKIIRTVGIIILVVAVVLIAVISTLQRRVRDKFASSNTEVEVYEVTTGTISTLVSGSGILENVDTENLTVPDGVEVTEILVEFGDEVEEGDLLALVDETTVHTALADIQSKIQSLDAKITSAKSDTVSSVISTGVGGRLKAVYAEVGSNVADVMVEHGAVALVSMDGYMAVDLEAEGVKGGDKVSVLRENGTRLEGTVKTAGANKMTVLVTDDGPKLDETVEVSDEDGNVLGSGQLYIHNPLAVTGYAGTVTTVIWPENSQIWAGTQLFYLKDTNDSANYDGLLRQRSETEETLMELVKLRKYGGITAPISGSVFSVADLEREEGYTDVVVLSPDVSMSVTIGVDEMDILALKLDQQADVTVSSVSEDILSGVVTEINKAAADGAYTAVITLDKMTGMLPGMTASIDVKIQGVENALIIPVDALHQTSTGSFVYTSYDEQTQQYGDRVDVTTGLRNDNYVEITSGLKAGDKVYYTEPQDFFSMFMMGNRGGMPSGNNRPSGGMSGR